MRAMLLAAGLGTRLRPVTDAIAKPAVPFLTAPLLFWSVEFLRSLSPDRFVINLHYQPDSIRALAPTLEKRGFEVRFTHEVTAPLGSGGALWFAKNELQDSETILVANADEVMFPIQDGTLQRLKAAHQKSGALATILTMKHPDVGTHFGGVWVDKASCVLGFGKDRTKFPKAVQGLHYVGVLLLDRRIFKYLPEGESNLLYDALIAGLAKGETVRAFCEDLLWFETGNPKDLLQATRDVLPYLSPQAKSSPASALVKDVVRYYGDPAVRLWESATGARLLASTYAQGSIGESVICETLEKEKAFAVIGAGAKVQAPILNSMALPKTNVARSTRDAIIIEPL